MDAPTTLEGFFSAEFDKALRELDMNSTMGMTSLRNYGSTIGEFLKGNPELGTACPDRVQTLKAFVWQRLNDPTSPDPIRVFVKQEPHKQSKLDEGRLRLISAVSLVDTMTDRIMFSWLSRKLLDNVGETPCMVGLSPVRGGHRWIYELFRGKNTRGLDMTAWDWTVPGWLFLALKDVVKSLALCAPAYWNDWVDVRWESLFKNAVFAFGDGTVVQQPTWGVMKSGCYLTIILNSFAQMIRHNLVLGVMNINPDSLITVFLGDDQTIEEFDRFSEYERITRSLGFLLKDSVVSTDEVHFIGFRFRRAGFIPEYAAKHVFRITHTPGDILGDVLSSYQILYAYLPSWFDWITRELVRVSPSRVLSVFEARMICSGKPFSGRC